MLIQSVQPSESLYSLNILINLLYSEGFVGIIFIKIAESSSLMFSSMQTSQLQDNLPDIFN